MGLTRSDADELLLALQFQRRIARDGARMADPGFWRELNPGLTISDRPLSDGRAAYDIPRLDARLPDQLHVEGCAVLPPIVPEADLDALRIGIRKLVDAGLPPGCLSVYDEPYRVYAGLRDLMTPLLGPDACLAPESLWAFRVPGGIDPAGRWTTFRPHRDAFVCDPGVVAGAMPSKLVAWVALTDVTAEDSCVHVLPADCDPDYRGESLAVDPARIRPQDVRVMMAPAGAVLLMSTTLLHWGGRGSPFRPEPRLSMTMIVQRKSDTPWLNLRTGFDDPLPFGDRIRALHRMLAAKLSADDLRAFARALDG